VPSVRDREPHESPQCQVVGLSRLELEVDRGVTSNRVGLLRNLGRMRSSSSSESSCG
jgi:hypothetical protein